MLARSRWSALALVPFFLASPGCTDDEKSCLIDAADYDQSCVVAEDCAIVTDFDRCDPCHCARAVINRNELDAFQSDVADLEKSATVCDCDGFIEVECVGGQCRGIDGSP